MFQYLAYPAPDGAGVDVHEMPDLEPERFERLPINLSRDEIRAMVVELLG